jgi:hypothetical protein
MRWSGTTNYHGWLSRLGVAIALASLLFASTVRAADIDDLTRNMPRGFLGEFSWEGDPTVQNVVITFDSVRALNEQNAEALGCGSYEAGRSVTKIKVRMFVRLPDLDVEILELAPEGNSSFETGGSHRGRLSKDFQRIDTQWTTTSSGQRGELHLRALPSVTCAPASAT